MINRQRFNQAVIVTIRVVTFLRLFKAAMYIQRALFESRAKRAKLPPFRTPAQVEKYFSQRFEYRKDKRFVGPLSLPFDWISHAEVVQYKLSYNHLADGDCDDMANWYGTALWGVHGVTNVRLISLGYKKDIPRDPSLGLFKRVIAFFKRVFAMNGHTTCWFRYEDRSYLADYKIRSVDGKSMEEVIANLCYEYSDGATNKPTWYHIYDLDFNPIETGPNNDQ